MSDDDAARGQTDAEAGADTPGLRVPFSVGAAPPGARARRWLGGVVVAKLALDLLFVCGLALYASGDTFRTSLEGSLDHADRRGASGWVSDESRPGAPVEVQLFVDGRFVAAAFADKPLPSAPADGARRGFVFDLDPPLEGGREARVFAVRAGRDGTQRTLLQVGATRDLLTR